MFKRLVLALILTTCPFLAQADIASDIRAGVPAETVIANALADGMNLEDIMDDIAQVVGSSEIGKFASAAVKVVALATGESENDAALRRAVGYAIGMAASQQYGGTAQGEAYTNNSTSFRPVSGITVSGISLVDITPAGALRGPTVAGGPSGTAPLGMNQGQTSGGGGGTALEDAVCEALGSEPGCASGIL